MGFSLDPVSAKVIMKELEKEILQTLMESGELKFYKTYVDNAQLIAKEVKIKYISDKLN